MNCKTCPVRNFVHADLYCLGCDHKPKPEIKSGIVYFYRKGAFKPVYSVEVKTPAGMECEAAAVKFIQQHRIDFIEGEL